MGWMSRLGTRIAQSLRAAELLTAIDSVDKLTYFKHLLKDNKDMQMTKLFLIRDWHFNYVQQ